MTRARAGSLHHDPAQVLHESRDLLDVHGPSQACSRPALRATSRWSDRSAEGPAPVEVSIGREDGLEADLHRGGRVNRVSPSEQSRRDEVTWCAQGLEVEGVPDNHPPQSIELSDRCLTTAHVKPMEEELLPALDAQMEPTLRSSSQA